MGQGGGGIARTKVGKEKHNSQEHILRWCHCKIGSHLRSIHIYSVGQGFGGPSIRAGGRASNGVGLHLNVARES